MPAVYTFELDGYVFPRSDVPARGPIVEFDEQRWVSQDVLGSTGQPSILTFIGTSSKKWTFRSRAAPVTKDKLVAVYTGRVAVVFKTPQNTTGFNVVMTRLEIEYAEPIYNSRFMCEFDLVKR